MIKQVNSWNELHLSDNLKLIMYGEEKNGITYSYKLAKNAEIPEIKNGYYLFIYLLIGIEKEKTGILI